jgi:hypothetical protein
LFPLIESEGTKMSFSRVFAVAFVCAGVLCGAKAKAVVDGIPAPNADRRFDAVGIFLTSSPGGACGGWVSGSCTLISANQVLIARHSLDITTSQPIPSLATRPCRVRFRRNTDGVSENSLVVAGDLCHGTYQEIDVVQLTDASNPNSDQVIATLDHAPIGISPLGIEVSSPTTGEANIILAGWGYAGECFQSGDHWALRVGRGISPTNAAASDFFLFTTCIVGSTTPCLQCPVGPGRVNANLHDSGAPILVEVPSTDPNDATPELRVVGSVSTLSYARRPSAWNHSGGTPALIQAAPPPHLKKSDFDGNGQITTVDLFAFFNAFLSGRMDADVNGDGTLEVQDVFLFLNEWFALQ